MKLTRERLTPTLLANLKKHLKKQGIRQADVAARLGVGYATVKRWLSGYSVSIEHLEDLCDLANISFGELVFESSQAETGKASHFTPSQERALGASISLRFIYFSILHGSTVTECERDLQISPGVMETHLAYLQRLGLIDILAPGRVRPLTTRNVKWNKKGPLSRHFEVMEGFMNPQTIVTVNMGNFVRLTDAGHIKVRHLMEELMQEIFRISTSEINDNHRDYTYYSFILFMKQLDMMMVRDAVSKENSNPRAVARSHR
jgi:transcriptional regulator with XRE-family HTH domain